MVARRENFQRVYDLRERVLPAWDDARLPPAGTAEGALVEKTVRALGVTQARWVPDYFRMERRAAREALQYLMREGTLIEVRVDGWSEAAYVHRSCLALAERAASGEVRARRTTFLSPFDPLVWHRERARVVFGFDYRLECYTPAAQRRWGYYVLPILRNGRLVGRMDAKAHRRSATFEVKSLHLEDGIRDHTRVARDVARALVALAEWHGTPAVQLDTIVPAAFGRLLRGAVREAASRA
jgi:hypothetical protein